MTDRRLRRHTEWGSRVRDVQRSFVTDGGYCEVSRVLYPPCARERRHLQGSLREDGGVSILRGEELCEISEHLRPPLLECRDVSLSQPPTAHGSLHSSHSCGGHHTSKNQATETCSGKWRTELETERICSKFFKWSREKKGCSGV